MSEQLEKAIALMVQQQEIQTQMLERVAAVEEQMVNLSQKMLDVIERDQRDRQKRGAEDVFIPISKAFETLGCNSVGELRDRIKDGYYRLGVEALDRRREDSRYPRYHVNVAKCRKRDQENPARRAG